MLYEEDPAERALYDMLAEELGVEAVLLVPTCTMANQIAIRLHLSNGGRLASTAFAHVVTIEARATALTGVVRHLLAGENGHPSPSTVADFVAAADPHEPALIWLENTHMLSAGSVMPAGWQAQIGDTCRKAGRTVHLDGSRLWNAAVAQNVTMATLVDGCDTVSISLNKAIGAPVGSVLGGSRAAIGEAVRWRDAMGGEWRPIGPIAAAAFAALDGWRERLERDTSITSALAAAITSRLGEDAVQPVHTNLIFLNRSGGDASLFVDGLALRSVGATLLTDGLVRLAIHNGVREPEVELVATAIASVDAELVTEQVS